MNNLLLIDIGNTAITYASYKSVRNQLGTSRTVLSDVVPLKLNICSLGGRLSFKTALICSTVPNITRSIVKQLKKAKLEKIYVVGKTLNPRIRCNYSPKNRLGPDRQLLIYGAAQKYGGPLIIIDVGTAITVDFISRNGTFLGGMIIPGPELSYHALLQRAALIPKALPLPLKRTSFLGKSTYECLQSGILEGFSAMLDGLISRYRHRFGREVKVVLTGGYASNLHPYMSKGVIHDPALLFDSLVLLYHEKIHALNCGK